MPAIETRDVTKQFGDVTALRSLDLTVEAGEIFGFLGPNGAGKSTAIDVVLDYVRPTAGTARVFGHDARSETLAIRDRVGVLPDGYHVIGKMTGREHLEFVVDSKGADEDPAAVLGRVGIADAADRVAADYSKGMAQRLVLGMALVGEPDLLILDEPTTGLDPNGARLMRRIVREENDRGATVFFSSHILEQVEAVCDRVGILRDGELVAVDTITGLRDSVGADARLSVDLDGPADPVRERVLALEGVNDATARGGTLEVACERPAKIEVLDAVREDGRAVLDFATTETSLEELFARYTEGEE
ncbi:MAG: ABC transporter ATP-binding protein [Haloarculaceae archaeon]